MSWLSNLTSKAEAMLVSLDQGTAHALQNPNPILKPVVKIFEDAPRGDSPSNRDDDDTNQLLSDEPVDQPEVVIGDPVQTQGQYYETKVIASTSHDAEIVDVKHIDSRLDDSSEIQHNIIGGESSASQDETQISGMLDKPTELINDTDSGESAVRNKTSQASRFKLQTTKLRHSPSDQSQRDRTTPQRDRSNGYKTTTGPNNIIVSPRVDDIRASINRSLQEYSRTSTYSSHRHRNHDDQTMYTSHFDNQPNLISNSSPPGSELGDYATASRLHSSPSFSIDVPTDDSRSPYDVGGQATNITDHILRQKTFTKKSAFNLHKVINKLSSQRIQSQSLLSDKTKIRLRRTQMRLASQFRRLNYYFRTHPSMKYWMIGYLVLLQLLVVYVLFFYQSSGSSTPLTSQVAQQQDELAELLRVNSEKLPSHPSNDLT